MSDLIKRADAMDALGEEPEIWNDTEEEWAYHNAWVDHISAIKSLPSAEAKGANLINRHDATTVIREECWKCNRLINADLLGRILALPTSRQTDCTEFIEWLIEIILDDEDWELNAVGYGEIIARKLKKLGLLEVKDGYYIRPSAEATCSTCADRALCIMSAPDGNWKACKDYRPQVETVQGWIPCSERLPSEDGRYLVCMDWEYDNVEVLRWADGWNCHRGYDGKISRESEIDGEDIVAWMPLPKPYREESEVEE